MFAIRRIWSVLVLILLSSCGGGGGGGVVSDGGAGCPTPGVCKGFIGNLDWDAAIQGGIGGDGASGGADGSGGAAAGGDLGQIRGAKVVVKKDDGSLLGNGEAETDQEKGMVTIKPGTYRGPLFIEVSYKNGAKFYDEGKNTYLDFPPDLVIRAAIPSITSNIGITPFSEAAYRLLTEGSTAERATGTITAAQIDAANKKVRDIVNQHFPASVQISDVARLPVIKSDTTPAGTIGVDTAGAYSLITGAFSKQAAMFNPAEPSPTLAATKQLGDDLLDGHLDGTRSGQSIATADKRTYDPNTWAGELSSALSQQTYRFGTGAAIDAMPAVTNFGSTRYESYLFDAKLTPSGQAIVTVAGWDGANDKGRNPGDTNQLLPTTARIQSVHGNLGNGSLFLKTDSDNSTSKLYALGDNTNGELGNGTRNATNAAVEVNLPGTMTHIAGGFGHTVARLADGSVYAWGDNSYGQLGQGVPSAQLVRSETPIKVNLPRGALSVAATNVASYALLDDGSVYSWGSSWGLGLLGDGTRDGVRLTPAAVLAGAGALSGVVQIAARDNDAMALTANGAVLTWGSFPTDAAGGFTGGRQVATPVAGLPSPSEEKIRKILTEQGLFVAQTTTGAVYHWGVHFDLTAQTILRDTVAVRVLNLPPVRDIMPGGFIGYGERPFDRVTAMGADPSGGLWKIRGRVAELFDPANPTAQRRPKSQAPRADCASCHGVLPTWPIKAPAPTSTAACVLPGFKLDAAGNAVLVNASTECTMCHNGVFRPFLNCVPQTLPPRVTPSTPPTTTTPCQLPANHAATPSGTVCATCHNSVIARPLACLPNTASDPLAPTTRASISVVIDDAVPITGNVPTGGVTNDATPTINGTLSAALITGQTLQLLRNGAVAGSPAVSGLTWSLTDGTQAPGSYTYAARVVQGARLGPTANSHTITIDTAAPSAAIATMNLVADAGPSPGVIAAGVATVDNTPQVLGTLSTALSAGDSLRILRGGVDVGAATVNGTGFSFTSATLGDGAYTFTARVVDAAGNIGSSADRALTINTSSTLTPPVTVTITRFDDDVTPSTGGFGSGASTNDGVPTLRGTLSRALSASAGERVRVFGPGSTVGAGTIDGTGWSYAPTLTDGAYTFSAQVIDGQGRTSAVSNSFTLTVDRTAPTGKIQSFTATDDAVPLTGLLSNTGNDPARVVSSPTNDNTPRLTITLTAPLAAGESFFITRSLAGAPATQLNVNPSAGASGGTYSFDDTLSSQFASPPSSSTSAPDPTFTALLVQYSVQVVDSAGNLGGQSALNLTLDYPICTNNSAYPGFANARTPLGTPIHGNVTVTSCIGCHVATAPGRNANSRLVPVPRTAPTSWCRFPN